MSSIATPSPGGALTSTASRNDLLSYEKSLRNSSNAIAGGWYPEKSSGDTTGNGVEEVFPATLGRVAADPPPQPSTNIAASPVAPMCNTPRRRTAPPLMTLPNSEPPADLASRLLLIWTDA